jgi:hypothetical protein
VRLSRVAALDTPARRACCCRTLHSVVVARAQRSCCQRAVQTLQDITHAARQQTSTLRLRALAPRGAATLTSSRSLGPKVDGFDSSETGMVSYSCTACVYQHGTGGACAAITAVPPVARLMKAAACNPTTQHLRWGRREQLGQCLNV